MTRRDLLFAALLIGGAGTLASTLTPPRIRPSAASPIPLAAPQPIIAAVDQALAASWRAQGVTPAPPASELVVLRRLALALTGAIPATRRDSPLRGPAARPPPGPLAGRPAERPADERLPRRAPGSGVGRDRRRPVPGLPAPAARGLAQRRVAAQPALRRGGPRPDRRRGALDRPTRPPTSSRSHLIPPGRRMIPSASPRGWPEPSWGSGSTAPSATITRSSPGSRLTFAGSPPSSARFSPASRESAMGPASSTPTRQGAVGPPQSSLGSRFAASWTRRSVRAGSGWLAGSRLPETAISPGPPPTGPGRSCSVAPWSSRSTTSPPRPTRRPSSACWPTTSPRAASTSGTCSGRSPRRGPSRSTRPPRSRLRPARPLEAAWAAFPISRLRPEQVAGATTPGRLDRDDRLPVAHPLPPGHRRRDPGVREPSWRPRRGRVQPRQPPARSPSASC